MRYAIFALLLVGNQPLIAAEPGLPASDPASVDLDAEKLNEIDNQVEAAIDEGQTAGAVVLIARGGKTVLLRAYGHRTLEPAEELMSADTIFDLASLTKPIATATSVMILADRGEIEIDAPVARYLPDFAANGKSKVTIAQLLVHTSGLTPENALADYADGPSKSFQRINALGLRQPAGEKFSYSDVGFLVLGQLVERISGKPLDQFAGENIFEPLAMSDTGYLVRSEDRDRCAATERRGGKWLRGEVHDPRAAALEGVAGHAGLFSTASDLARFGQMLLEDGGLDGKKILSRSQVAAMLHSRTIPGGIRTWGWDRRTVFSSNRGNTMSDHAFGHGGFTGTGIWIDPGHDLIVVFLSNRLHPDGRGSVNRLIGRVGTIAVDAIRK